MRQFWEPTFFACILLALFCSTTNVNYFVKTLEGNINIFDVVEAKYAYMLSPSGLSLGLNGDLFVSDISRHLVFRIYDNMSTAEVYAGFGTSGYNGDGLSAIDSLFNTPTSISVNPLNGDLYITDTLNDMIRIVSKITKTVSSISQGTFNRPSGICVSPNGFVYIADTQNNLIKKYEISTMQVSIIRGGGYLSGDYDGVDAKLLKLQLPKNIFVRSNGNKDVVYFTDEERVKSIDENGIYRIVDGGLPQSNLFGIFVTNQGEIFSTSQSNHFIQMKMTKSSQTTLFIGNSSVSGYSGDGQLYDSSTIKFYEPSSLVVTTNFILVADKSNNCIRKINLQDRMVSTLSGGIINHPHGENISPLKMKTIGNAQFPFSYKGDFYFVEKNSILRKVSNGKMTTVFGCEKDLTYSANIPQRIYFIIINLSYVGNGNVIFHAGIQDTIYNFNIDTQTFTVITKLSYYTLSYSLIGDPLNNFTLYYRTNSSNICTLHSLQGSASYCLDIPITGSVDQIIVIPDFRIQGTNSVFYYKGIYNSINEYTDYKNGSMSISVTEFPVSTDFRGFSYYERTFYFWSFGQTFEMNMDTYLFKISLRFVS